MRTAIYPGSFDPITNGHLDLVQRAAKLFDRVIVAVAVNDGKKPLFTLSERMEMVKTSLQVVPQGGGGFALTVCWWIMWTSGAGRPLSAVCGRCRILNLSFNWR